MKKLFAAVMLIAAFSVSAYAGGDLESFLRNVDSQARVDLNSFTTRVSVHFGVTPVQVQAVLGRVSKPSDAFMVFQLGKMTSAPSERVLNVYQTRKSAGWGVIAKELGIKPGSPAFHALKRGDFGFGDGSQTTPGKGKGKGKAKGKNKD